MAIDTVSELETAEKELIDMKKRLVELRKQAARETVKDYVFQTAEGPVRLSELFGESDDLIVVHNMGKGCPHCTMWADGFQGLYKHIRDPAPFALTSPDAPKVQCEFAKSRGWEFPVLSTQGTTFREDLGFDEDGKPMPGISTFRRFDDGRIERVSRAHLGDHDDFNAAWSMFNCAKGLDGCEPKFSY